MQQDINPYRMWRNTSIVLLLLTIIFCMCSCTPKGKYLFCDCFNCTDHTTGIIPVLTMEEFESNLNNYIEDLPEELPQPGDYIALKNHGDTMFVRHFHSQYKRKFYKGWYIYQLK